MRQRILALGLSCLLCWLSLVPLAWAWGDVGHAAIGELAEEALQTQDPRLRTLILRLREGPQRPQVRKAMLGFVVPAPGRALRTLANWPDWYKRQPGMLSADDQRHYVNLPFTARYQRTQHCANGLCSLETLLEQRAILARQRTSLAQRAVALAWVAHLVGDMHQPLHAGQAEDRGGNLTCVTWMGTPSERLTHDGKVSCSGTNLHVVWDSTLLETTSGVTDPDALAPLLRQLRPLWQRVQATEPPLTARTPEEWRAVVERWHHETQALIVGAHIYPPHGVIDAAYVQRHSQTVRLQLVRAAVRLAAMLQQSL
ncbi:MAG: S1/P1 nuclease [Candidatus Tectomicrobia bacterium]|uniref:S1/P1 nuclease n=1 Tax=Tectimicrobiota bacterium TaxID=2528274 RepID=A0A938B0Z7_UNCTE|nr:S1/P1 nuclease [Candidatus Tectomicrobia bacterium]